MNTAQSPQPGGWTATLAAAAICLALVHGPLFLSLVGIPLALMAPAPLVVLYRRQGKSQGRRGILTAVSGLAALLFLGDSGTVGLLAYVLAVAWLLGEAPFRGWPDDLAVGFSGAVAVLWLLGWLMALSFLGGVDLPALWAEQNKAAIDTMMGYVAQTQEEGAGAGEMEAFRQSLEQSSQVLIRLAFGILAGVSLMVGWANLLLARRLTRDTMPQGDLTLWSSPGFLVWVLILSGGLMALTDGLPYWVGANAVLVLSVVYFFQGMAVVAYWMKKKNAPVILRAIIYTMAVAEILVSLVVALAGLFDLWFNFRRLDNSAPS